MPQLDKLSFSTQYIWLTVFFFALYYISTNFFGISIFKGLKLRGMVDQIWKGRFHRFSQTTFSNGGGTIINNMPSELFITFPITIRYFDLLLIIVGHFQRSICKMRKKIPIMLYWITDNNISKEYVLESYPMVVFYSKIAAYFRKLNREGDEGNVKSRGANNNRTGSSGNIKNGRGLNQALNNSIKGV